MRKLLVGLFSVCAAMTAVAALAAIDIGPKVGSSIPSNFSAVEPSGRSVDFDAVSGEKGLVLAFVRSAAWCPYCQSQLIDLQSIADDLAKRGYRLAALSYDAPDVLAGFAKKRGIGYTLLSDQKSAVIDAFDLRDPQYAPGSKAHGVPRPAIFIIGRDGVIRGKLAEDGYKVRPTVADILKEVDALAGR